MAATTGPAVGAALVAAGMDPATPVAVVVDAARDGQRVIAGSVGRLAALDGPLPGPCVLVVGAVARRAVGLAVATLDDELVGLGRHHD